MLRARKTFDLPTPGGAQVMVEVIEGGRLHSARDYSELGKDDSIAKLDNHNSDVFLTNSHAILTQIFFLNLETLLFFRLFPSCFLMVLHP